jgi:hypothetical protein
MRKLLLGTSLASAMLLAGSAYAETKVSGYLETTIGSSSTSNSSSVNGSTPSAIGHESSIDLSMSKELDNGLALSAGFGTENGTQTDQFLKLSSGNTTFAIGSDITGVADNVSQEDFTPYIAQDIHTTGLAKGNLEGINSVHGNNAFYLIQKTDLANIEFAYSPNVDNGGTAAASNNTGRSTTTTDAASGYDVAVHGNMGVEGLKVGYGISKQKAVQSTGTSDKEGTGYGVKYAMNGFEVGYGKTTNKAANTTTESENTAYGIAYKVSDALSLGYYQAEYSVDGTALDEEYKSVQVGYDLGGMGITVSLIQLENASGTSGNDEEKLEIRTVNKF